MCPACLTTLALIAADDHDRRRDGDRDEEASLDIRGEKHSEAIKGDSIMTTNTRGQTGLAFPNVVSRAEWLAARKELLAKEKELSHHRDAVNTQLRQLPMVKIEKDYVFAGPDGNARLLDLFCGQRQLIVYHFMFGPDWDEGCPSCSFTMDNVGHLSHLRARNTAFAAISRAPLAKIEPFKKRMGWTFPWYSSFGSDFNYDFHVTFDEAVAPIEYNYRSKADMMQKGETYYDNGEEHGLSVFLREGSDIYHTYSTYGRGTDLLMGTYIYLDMTPLGRQEDWEQPPGRGDGPLMHWVRHHDRYEGPQHSGSCCGSGSERS